MFVEMMKYMPLRTIVTFNPEHGEALVESIISAIAVFLVTSTFISTVELTLTTSFNTISLEDFPINISKSPVSTYQSLISVL